MTSSHGGAVLTIGHSNHPLERFLELLEIHRVTVVADVRSAPYSRRYPDYSREQLRRALNARSVRYLFLGAELGARPQDPSCYAEGRVQYRRLAQATSFRRGLERVLGEARSSRVALLCAEKEPLDCHRAVLIARELEALDTEVAHIHADARLETHAEALERLLDMLKLRQLDLFGTSDALIDQAYNRQEQRIAYARPDAAESDDLMNEDA